MTWSCEQCGATFKARGTRPRRFCRRACADAWMRRDRPSAEWLRRKYIDERLGAPSIGLLVGRDGKTVWGWLRQAGIPTRSRGTDPVCHFVKGAPSAFAGKRHTEATKQAIRARSVADGRVPYLKDGKHHLRGKRGAETPNWKGGITPERQTFYRSDEWKRIAPAVWVRDHFTCQRCGAKPPSTGPKHNRGHIHHIVGFHAVEFRAVLTNLVLLCAPCHRWVHSNANSEGDLLG